VSTLRADAQRNLDRLLEAASACFAERGAEVSVDEIARRAGVGHGTVFRRFPSKDALLAACVLQRVRSLAAAADAALEEPDPWEAFAGFFRLAAETYARDRALVDGFGSCIESEEVIGFVAAVARLAERAQGAGALRADLDARDLLALVPAASRYPEVILDGLRARSGPSRLSPSR
jgi:AcrR family transcriptional regulator